MENEKPVTQQETKCYPNMPAFASSESYGLTKREYFAAMAMQGLLSRLALHEEISNSTGTKLKYPSTDAAVSIADDLIQSLNQ